MVTRLLLVTALLLPGCVRFSDEIDEPPSGEGGAGGEAGAGGQGGAGDAEAALTGLQTSGSCPDPADPDRLFIYLNPLDGETGLRPLDRLADGAVTELLTREAVRFAAPDDDAPEPNGEATPVGGGDAQAVQLSAERVAWVGEDVLDSQRLVVLVVDNSARMDVLDPNGNRDSLVRKLIRLLPEDVLLGIVVAEGDEMRVVAPTDPDYDFEFDRAVGAIGLGDGTAPLADALQRALDEVVPAAPLAPTVFLLTTDRGSDPSVKSIDEVGTAYRDRGVPIVVGHLVDQSPFDEELRALACTTGGSALAIDLPAYQNMLADPLTADAYTPALAARLLGGWRLETRVEHALTAGDWALSTRVSISLGNRTRARALLDRDGVDDRVLFAVP